MKYIFITGGVVSGLGKGITSASLGRLLKVRGKKVTLQKFDPYINIDPGTMSPIQHGEVFVTDDGAETDLDIGHYERFVDENLTRNSNVTSGKIFWSVLNKERKGEYLGATIQIIPHITNEIKDRIYRAGKQAQSDIVITEIGGTVGDIEGQPFLEAIRQVSYDVGRENVLFIHVTLIPIVSVTGEMKSKPSQHSVKELLSIGIQPDILVCRTEHEMPKEMRDKLALFCNISPDAVIQNLDASSLYEVPLLFEKENFANIVINKLHLEAAPPDLTEWTELVKRQKSITRSVTVALVGKYVELHDAYLSVVEALNHAGIHNDVDVKIKWIKSESLEQDTSSLEGVDAILVPGGFGDRGIEGKITAIKIARTKNIPILGICLGLQCMVIEYARNVLGIAGANSSEIDPKCTHPVIDLMPEQKDVEELGGSMRLGAYPCKLSKDSNAYNAYGQDLIYERHRHRYEVNNEFRDVVFSDNLVVTGVSPNDKLVEIVELRGHKWFTGTQYHPEFKSRPNRPHPLFRDFIKATLQDN